MAEIKFNCFECSKELSFVDHVGFRDECDHCGADVHCCKNCRFHDPKSYNECRETSADPVREKDRANYCEYYSGAGGAENENNKDALRLAAEALFKK